MEECVDIGAIDDILNFNSDDDQEAYSKPGQKALTHGPAPPPAFVEEQEELEWISNFPPVEEYVLAGGQEKHQSPVSVLENSNCNTNNNSRSVIANCGTLGVPVRARSQRFRKPRRCFADIPKQRSSRNQGNGKHIRACLHCGADKTPQWRAGPLGPKTLCNACGVRYKSGRLVAEYRPANSPTFSSQLHSNSHRKIIEMRRQKQIGLIAGKPVDTG